MNLESVVHYSSHASVIQAILHGWQEVGVELFVWLHCSLSDNFTACPSELLEDKD